MTERFGSFDSERIQEFAAGLYDAAPDCLRLYPRELRGGLSSAVLRVGVAFRNPERTPRTACFVVKRASGDDLREAQVYTGLLSRAGGGFSPGLYGADPHNGSAYLYLEWVNAWRRWPWADEPVTRAVLKQLAVAHETLSLDRFAELPLAGWDYEAQLRESAAETVAVIAGLARHSDLGFLRKGLPAVRRLAEALPRFRPQFAGAVGRAVVLHGDVHPGNVRIRLAGKARRPVFLDWARTRTGSCMEDVSSWLKSLGYWEPAVKRRHDTLLRDYLQARGLPDTLGSTVREAYWLAAAGNALAGALRYYCVQIGEGQKASGEWWDAVRAAYDWMRMTTRADACLRA